MLRRKSIDLSIRSINRVSPSRIESQPRPEKCSATSEPCIKPTIPLGKRFWPLRADEQREIKRLFRREDVRRLATSLRSRNDKDPIEVLDAAYWMKGCSSLGRLRYAVLVGIGDPPYKGESLCLMDIKEAVQAVAPRYSRARMPRDNAQRVVEGRNALVATRARRRPSRR
jgi:uncharacterized protein (DUF2252 family)